MELIFFFISSKVETQKNEKSYKWCVSVCVVVSGNTLHCYEWECIFKINQTMYVCVYISPCHFAEILNGHSHILIGGLQLYIYIYAYFKYIHTHNIYIYIYTRTQDITRRYDIFRGVRVRKSDHEFVW
jgi:hypothetical protein